MESSPITNKDDIIHSRDLFARINWLRQALNYRFSEAHRKELETLYAFEKNVEAVSSASTYDPGADLVRDSYLEEYRKAMSEPDGQNVEFSRVDFGGILYWLRH